MDRSFELHPWSLTWNLKICPWKRRFLLKTIISRFHVKLCLLFNRWFRPPAKDGSSGCYHLGVWSPIVSYFSSEMNEFGTWKGTILEGKFIFQPSIFRRYAIVFKGGLYTHFKDSLLNCRMTMHFYIATFDRTYGSRMTLFLHKIKISSENKLGWLFFCWGMKWFNPAAALSDSRSPVKMGSFGKH